MSENPSLTVVVSLQSQELKSSIRHRIFCKPIILEVKCLIFITLSKWKQAPSKERMKRLDQATETFKELEKQGIKMQVYWTLGSYDGVTIIEAPTEKDAMKALLLFQDVVATETLVAVPREEALKLL
jgi:uncharacterized protein with GYD domain